MKRAILFVLGILCLFSCSKHTENSESSSKTDTILMRNGKVITFPKFGSALTVMRRDKTEYAPEYLIKINKIVEYYLANSKQHTVKDLLENPNANIGFSVEQDQWDDVMFTKIGIFDRRGNNVSTAQWLFYNPKTQELFEYDLQLRKMVKFEM